MPYLLTPEEVRVLGCLLEKELTTPEYYPLSMHALTAACNQKSCREPMVQYDEALVRDAMESLGTKGLAGLISGSGHYVVKGRQRLTEQHPLDLVERAILTELMLRGPQTPGELRTRGERLTPIPELATVQAALESINQRTDGPWVAALPREPGRKEIRYQHLLSGAPAATADQECSPAPASASPAAATVPMSERLARCEQELTSLKADMDQLRQQMDAFRKQFE